MWLVARTLAQTFASDFDNACAPYQYALTTRAGTECVGHLLRSLTQLDDRATIVSIDGVGAFDHISRSSMLTGLLNCPNACQTLPLTLACPCPCDQP